MQALKLNVRLDLLVWKFGTFFLLSSKGGGWLDLDGIPNLVCLVWVPRWAALGIVGLGVAQLVVVPSGIRDMYERRSCWCCCWRW